MQQSGHTEVCVSGCSRGVKSRVSCSQEMEALIIFRWWDLTLTPSFLGVGGHMVGGRWFLHSLPAALSLRNCILEGDSCIFWKVPWGGWRSRLPRYVRQVMPLNERRVSLGEARCRFNLPFLSVHI